MGLLLCDVGDGGGSESGDCGECDGVLIELLHERKKYSEGVVWSYCTAWCYLH